MTDYIVHKAVDADKVKKKLQRTPEYMAEHYIAQAKMDGCCAVMLLTQYDSKVLSRTGEHVTSMGGVARSFRDKYVAEVFDLGGIVLIGEAWNPSLPQNVISGLFRQHALTDDLLMMVFDCLTMAEFYAGHSDVPYVDRMARLTTPNHGEDVIAAWPPGTFGTVEEFLSYQLALGGRDGIILRDPQGTWTAGRGTTGEIIKVKQNLSFDLAVVEIKEAVGIKTGRPVYTLVVQYGDTRLTIGSGVPHDLGDLPAIGQIVEIEAMAESSKGLLREPRFKGIRYDKLEPDTIAA